MRVLRIPARTGTSERRCHCGKRFDGADHCPYCGCEQWERYCDASYEAGFAARSTWLPGERHAGYDAREDFAGQSDMGEPAP